MTDTKEEEETISTAESDFVIDHRPVITIGSCQYLDYENLEEGTIRFQEPLNESFTCICLPFCYFSCCFYGCCNCFFIWIIMMVIDLLFLPTDSIVSQIIMELLYLFVFFFIMFVFCLICVFLPISIYIMFRTSRKKVIFEGISKVRVCWIFGIPLMMDQSCTITLFSETFDTITSFEVEKISINKVCSRNECRSRIREYVVKCLRIFGLDDNHAYFIIPDEGMDQYRVYLKTLDGVTLPVTKFLDDLDEVSKMCNILNERLSQ